MLLDAEDAEKVAQSKLQSQQEMLGKESFEQELSKIAASSDAIQRKTSALRQASLSKAMLPETSCIYRLAML